MESHLILMPIAVKLGVACQDAHVMKQLVIQQPAAMQVFFGVKIAKWHILRPQPVVLQRGKVVARVVHRSVRVIVRLIVERVEDVVLDVLNVS